MGERFFIGHVERSRQDDRLSPIAHRAVASAQEPVGRAAPQMMGGATDAEGVSVPRQSALRLRGQLRMFAGGRSGFVLPKPKAGTDQIGVAGQRIMPGGSADLLGQFESGTK